MDLARSCKKRAEDKGLEYDITAEDLQRLYELQDGKCNYTGVPLKIKTERKHTKRLERNRVARMESNDNNTYHNRDKASVDRIDPSRGYTRDNIHLIRVHVNYAKLDMTEEDFFSMCRSVVTRADARTGPTIAPLMEQDESSSSPSLSPSSAGSSQAQTKVRRSNRNTLYQKKTTDNNSFSSSCSSSSSSSLLN